MNQLKSLIIRYQSPITFCHITVPNIYSIWSQILLYIQPKYGSILYPQLLYLYCHTITIFDLGYYCKFIFSCWIKTKGFRCCKPQITSVINLMNFNLCFFWKVFCQDYFLQLVCFRICDHPDLLGIIGFVGKDMVALSNNHFVIFVLIAL